MPDKAINTEKKVNPNKGRPRNPSASTILRYVLAFTVANGLKDENTIADLKGMLESEIVQASLR